MTQLAGYLAEERIRIGVEAATRDDVLLVLAELLGGKDLPSREAIYDDLRAREDVSTTAVGGGIAYPHARVDLLSGLRMALLRTSRPIDFGALDGRDVDLFFALAGPAQDRREYLAVLSKLTYLLRVDLVRDAFRTAKGAQEVLELVRRLTPQSVNAS